MRRLVAFVLVFVVIAATGIGGAITQAEGPRSYVAAGPGTAFTYQGQLKQSGTVANGSFDFQFSLWDSATGGIQVGTTKTLLGVSVTDGLFAVQLDFGNVFDGSARWLQMDVRPAGSGSYTSLSPRQALAPAPYALHATDAHTIDGRSSSAFWNTAGNSGTSPGTNFLGTTDSVALELDVNGASALRLEPTTETPNLIGGYSGNSVASGKMGGVIAGGGRLGTPNQVSDDYGAVGGGAANVAGAYANVGGGYSNSAGAYSAVVAGGNNNTASNSTATVGGGSSNTASGIGSLVAGGRSNTASGWDATVPGGYGNAAAGDSSFAAGNRAKANNTGAFVWADSTPIDFTSTAPNQFMVRASGGVTMTTNTGGTTGATLLPGSGSWSSLSDRNAKENLAPVNGQSILEKVASVPIDTWNYKAQDKSIRHIGPMAQDFYAAFNVGEDDKHISTVDADGVALASIQGLYQEVRERDARIAAQQRSIEDLQKRLAALEKQVGGQ